MARIPAPAQDLLAGYPAAPPSLVGPVGWTVLALLQLGVAVTYGAHGATFTAHAWFTASALVMIGAAVLNWVGYLRRSTRYEIGVALRALGAARRP